MACPYTSTVVAKCFTCVHILENNTVNLGYIIKEAVKFQIEYVSRHRARLPLMDKDWCLFATYTTNIEVHILYGFFFRHLSVALRFEHTAHRGQAGLHTNALCYTYDGSSKPSACIKVFMNSSVTSSNSGLHSSKRPVCGLYWTWQAMPVSPLNRFLSTLTVVVLDASPCWSRSKPITSDN